MRGGDRLATLLGAARWLRALDSLAPRAPRTPVPRVTRSAYSTHSTELWADAVSNSRKRTNPQLRAARVGVAPPHSGTRSPTDPLNHPHHSPTHLPIPSTELWADAVSNSRKRTNPQLCAARVGVAPPHTRTRRPAQPPAPLTHSPSHSTELWVDALDNARKRICPQLCAARAASHRPAQGPAAPLTHSPAHPLDRVVGGCARQRPQAHLPTTLRRAGWEVGV
ncbi:hypothetical protein PSCLAVI8L_150188 [Pseudoclavibacter sp. 8L]|nr:hypothetical protein PSCLAVI8L_150188 [Pseudoclavibacter sp. 8L]